MTKKEIIERNIGLTFDFVHHLMDNKDKLDKLPANFEIEFIDKDFKQVEMKKETVRTESEAPKKYIRVKRTFEAI
ncbi:DUF5647 family protein [Petrimonas sp.]|uniref:DUF5647 family protein n=1 Tax=Petrimonas sp. TaxID=2023866 RepID=UPI003F517471